MFFALFLVPLFLVVANAVPNPGPCSGDCWAHDPSLLQRKSDGKYFLFSTDVGISISMADNLGGPWKRVGNVLPDGSSINVAGADSKHPWAPDVHFLDNTYYLYYSVSVLGQKTSSIGVASSPTMDPGSWKDHGAIGITSDQNTPFNAIDANFVIVDRTYYLNFGSYWDGIQQIMMKDSLTKQPGANSYRIALNSTGDHPIEASFMFENNGFYYLLFSSGIAAGYADHKPAPGDEYRIVVCRSQKGTADFVDANGVACTKNGGTTLLDSHDFVYGPGGQGVMGDDKLGPVLYYHYANTDVGLGVKDYKLGYNQIKWTKDNWPTL